jgi:hypothetical protein
MIGFPNIARLLKTATTALGLMAHFTRNFVFVVLQFGPRGITNSIPEGV